MKKENGKNINREEKNKIFTKRNLNFFACAITVEYKFYLLNESANRTSCCEYIDLNQSAEWKFAYKLR